MEWDSDDMTDSEYSEWEDPEERENRLWVEQYNYDLIEGMTLMTYTPLPRKMVCWSLTSLCHSNGHIETMPAREINPFTALTRIRPQFLRTQ